MENIKSFAVSVQGYGHKIKGICCQDSSLKYNADDYILISVCDGHGGESYFRSQIGSKIGVETFKDCVQELMKTDCIHDFLNSSSDTDPELSNKFKRDFNASFIHLVKNFILNWRNKVYEHYNNNPFKETEMSRIADNNVKQRYLSGKNIYSAYGTTFLGVCYSKKLCFGFQIGDGDLVAQNKNGIFFNLVEDDPKCVGNMTTSLCADDAFDNVRRFVLVKDDDDYPVAIFASSDGVINSFDSRKNFEKFYSQIIAESTKDHNLEQELNDVLDDLSKNGSRDDVSLAGIINHNSINIVGKDDLKDNCVSDMVKGH